MSFAQPSGDCDASPNALAPPPEFPKRCKSDNVPLVKFPDAHDQLMSLPEKQIRSL
jgi:hypothetical protein